MDNPYGYQKRSIEPGRRSGAEGRGAVAIPDRLTRRLAQDVLARLARRVGAEAPGTPMPDAAAIEMFCRQLIEQQLQGNDLSLGLPRVGPLDTSSHIDVYETWIAESARLLGEWWVEDRASFVDVTVGVGHLSALLREISVSVPPPALPEDAPVALLSNCPGDDHTLGLAVVADQFRRAGWNVHSITTTEPQELLRAVEDVGPSYIGLSIATLRLIPVLADVIPALRLAGPRATICVGGSAVLAVPDLRARVGADSVATDAAGAAALARSVRGERVHAGG